MTALVSWPGRIAPGTVVDGPIHIVDVYPALARRAVAPLIFPEAMGTLKPVRFGSVKAPDEEKVLETRS